MDAIVFMIIALYLVLKPEKNNSKEEGVMAELTVKDERVTKLNTSKYEDPNAFTAISSAILQSKYYRGTK